MLVYGYSGIGKSSLINEIHRPLVKERGHFISGKFDQFKRNIPYASFIQAFKQLVQGLLTESDQKLDYWKEALSTALGARYLVVLFIEHQVLVIIGVKLSLMYFQRWSI